MSASLKVMSIFHPVSLYPANKPNKLREYCTRASKRTRENFRLPYTPIHGWVWQPICCKSNILRFVRILFVLASFRISCMCLFIHPNWYQSSQFGFFLHSDDMRWQKLSLIKSVFMLSNFLAIWLCVVSWLNNSKWSHTKSWIERRSEGGKSCKWNFCASETFLLELLQKNGWQYQCFVTVLFLITARKLRCCHEFCALIPTFAQFLLCIPNIPVR